MRFGGIYAWTWRGRYGEIIKSQSHGPRLCRSSKTAHERQGRQDADAEMLEDVHKFRRKRSGADGRMEGLGERLAETLDVGFVFGFDHDAGKLLGAGVTQHHAAFVAQCGLSFG